MRWATGFCNCLAKSSSLCFAMLCVCRTAQQNVSQGYSRQRNHKPYSVSSHFHHSLVSSNSGAVSFPGLRRDFTILVILRSTATKNLSYWRTGERCFTFALLRLKMTFLWLCCQTDPLPFFRFSSREEEYVWMRFKGRSFVHDSVQTLVQIRRGCKSTLPTSALHLTKCPEHWRPPRPTPYRP